MRRHHQRGAGAPSVYPVGPMAQFGQQFVGFDAALQSPAVAPVGGDDLIVRPQRGECADRHRLLANAGMNRTCDAWVGSGAQREGEFLEATDTRNLLVGANQEIPLCSYYHV